MERLEGWHLIFDGVLADRPTAVQLRGLLKALITETGLSAISPLTVWVSSLSWSALVMIAESHISAHGIERLGCVDVFSCRPLKEGQIAAIIGQHLAGDWQSEWARRPVLA